MGPDDVPLVERGPDAVNCLRHLMTFARNQDKVARFGHISA